MKDKLLDLDLDRRFTASVKPKLCIAAIAGLALVNSSSDSGAAEFPQGVSDRRVAAAQSRRTAVDEKSSPTPEVTILRSFQRRG